MLTCEALLMLIKWAVEKYGGQIDVRALADTIGRAFMWATKYSKPGTRTDLQGKAATGRRASLLPIKIEKCQRTIKTGVLSDKNRLKYGKIVSPHIMQKSSSSHADTKDQSHDEYAPQNTP